MECYVCALGYTISDTFVIILSLVDDAIVLQVGRLVGIRRILFLCIKLWLSLFSFQ